MSRHVSWAAGTRAARPARAGIGRKKCARKARQRSGGSGAWGSAAERGGMESEESEDGHREPSCGSAWKRTWETLIDVSRRAHFGGGHIFGGGHFRRGPKRVVGTNKQLKHP